jgi:hypothetical protein
MVTSCNAAKVAALPGRRADAAEKGSLAGIALLGAPASRAPSTDTLRSASLYARLPAVQDGANVPRYYLKVHLSLEPFD